MLIHDVLKSSCLQHNYQMQMFKSYGIHLFKTVFIADIFLQSFTPR